MSIWGATGWRSAALVQQNCWICCSNQPFSPQLAGTHPQDPEGSLSQRVAPCHLIRPPAACSFGDAVAPRSALPRCRLRDALPASAVGLITRTASGRGGAGEHGPPPGRGDPAAAHRPGAALASPGGFTAPGRPGPQWGHGEAPACRSHPARGSRPTRFPAQRNPAGVQR